MSEDTRRKRLFPGWMFAAVGSAVCVVILGVGLMRWTYVSSQVTVPDLVGRPVDVAETSAELAGLELRVTTRLFSSTVGEGVVLTQDPAGGGRLRKGDAVEVVVSAGTEAVDMPDVVGLSLKEATGELADIGIGVTTVDVVSPAEAGTVVESYPSPGVEITTGDTVRLSVAIGGPLGESLLPYILEDLHVVIDPVPVSGEEPDIALEVTWRLQSLLEASGARVTLTRSTSETMPPVADRIGVVTASGANLLIGLDVDESGVPGLTPAVVQVSDEYANGVAEALVTRFMTLVRSDERPVNVSVRVEDDVIGKVLAPGVRLVLGTLDSGDDQLRFADQEWADAVARAFYRAIGETFTPE